MKRKHISLCIALCLVLLILSACQSAEDAPVTLPENNVGDNTPVQDHTQDAGQPADLPEEPQAPEEPADTDPAWVWGYDSPQNRRISSSALDALHQTLDTTNVLSAAIVREGVIVDEYYKEGYDETSSFLLHSASKSVTSALIGIAIDKGYIEGVDVPISQYFPQILTFDNPYWQDITIWHLLTHTPGIATTDDVLWNEWLQSDNWVDYVLDLPVTSAPGTVFNYSTGNTHLLAAILQQATGQTLYDFGKEHLFDPLDMDSVRCDADPQGISDGGNGIWMNSHDMLKFGQLFLDGGVHDGQQIISSQWVEDSTTLQYDRSTGSADYGYQWWVRTFGQNAYPAFFAQGHGGQYIFVVPQLELVVTFTSNHNGSSSMYWQFVNDIVAACQP